MLDSTYRALVGALPLSEVMILTGASARTARRWYATGRAPQWAIDRLQQWRYGIPVHCPAWDGFSFRQGVLWTPEGAEVTPGQVRALPYLQELNRALQQRLARPEQFRLV